MHETAIRLASPEPRSGKRGPAAPEPRSGKRGPAAPEPRSGKRGPAAPEPRSGEGGLATFALARDERAHVVDVSCVEHVPWLDPAAPRGADPEPHLPRERFGAMAVAV